MQNQHKTDPPNPKSGRLSRRMLWLTVLKAAEGLRKINRDVLSIQIFPQSISQSDRLKTTLRSSLSQSTQNTKFDVQFS